MATAAKWYIVQAYSGYEKKVAEAIKASANLHGLEALIEEVLVPVEEVVEIKKGKKVTSEHKFFPGYVLAKMLMTDASYHLIKNTPKVSGFLGASGKPFPISEKEVQQILHQVEEGVDRKVPAINYDLGEEVRVIDGPFNSFIGIVEGVDVEKMRLKVSVSIFGRATPVELEYNQVEKN
ncbi:MAG: transcription termination/antitermination protein NusG [Kordiimonadaceae bacterium]|jgi:transcription termination/antitermination protein NusG|nr:transcription termination/antitermination protein NusG [Kordiimonadaceae bacterium]MBT7583802.1 transcription termination/antitermination protein NusG [Kordiimonadaceae bacterium]